MCRNSPKGAHRRTKAKKSHNLPRPLGEQDDILGRVITGDETWFYQYDPETKRQSAWILHHDNAPAHTALSVREFLATNQITVLEHPAYSPDLAPNEFFLFPKIKEILKGRHFDDINDIRRQRQV